MAWTFESVVEVAENIHTKRWYLHFLITDGNEVRREALKFQEKPSQKQGQDAIVAFLKQANDAVRVTEKERSPPNVGDLFTNPQKATLRDSVLVLESVIETVDEDIRRIYREFVADYRAKLEKFVR